GMTWKSSLNNLRLLIQPYIFYNLISPWLDVFKIPGFRRKFYELIELMNTFPSRVLPFSIKTSLVA
ncbi:MAG: IS701 family transposase, partial [Actinomycetota bacterium]